MLKEAKIEDLLYGMIFSPIDVIALWKYHENIEIHPQDILLIMNLVHSSKQIREEDCWIPMCLPGIAKDGYLYAYIYFIT